MNRADTARLMAFITRRVDKARMAYGHNRVDKERMSVMVGTTNGREVLPGAKDARLRRWIPVEVGWFEGLTDNSEAQRKHVRDTVAAYREKLWAEAIALYNEGYTSAVPAQYEAALARYTKSFQATNHYLDSAIEEALEGKAPPIAHQEICMAVDINNPARVSGAVTDALRAYGYVPKKVTIDDGRRAMRWVPA